MSGSFIFWVLSPEVGKTESPEVLMEVILVRKSGRRKVRKFLKKLIKCLLSFSHGFTERFSKPGGLGFINKQIYTARRPFERPSLEC